MSLSLIVALAICLVRLLQTAAVCWVITAVMTPTGALAENNPSFKPLHEIALDIDHDAKSDRAVLVEDPASGAADLYIYLAIGSGKVDLSRKP